MCSGFFCRNLFLKTLRAEARSQPVRRRVLVHERIAAGSRKVLIQPQHPDPSFGNAGERRHFKPPLLWGAEVGYCRTFFLTQPVADACLDLRKREVIGCGDAPQPGTKQLAIDRPRSAGKLGRAPFHDPRTSPSHAAPRRRCRSAIDTRPAAVSLSLKPSSVMVSEPSRMAAMAAVSSSRQIRTVTPSVRARMR